ATVLRYTANGTLDTSFGSGGKLITNIQVQPNADHSVGIAPQPDGKIVLGSTTLDPATRTGEFVTARFNANGTADSTFGSGGKVTTHLGTFDEFGGVTVQGDGKIVVSGSESTGTSPFALYLLRYNADGSLDTTFGTGETVAVQAPDGNYIDPRGSGVAVQADGKILAGGEFGDATGQLIDLAALRVNPDGSVDTGYGNGGWAMVPFASADMQAIALEPDGQLLLAGYGRPTSNTRPVDVALIRFTADTPTTAAAPAIAATPATAPVTAGTASSPPSSAALASVSAIQPDEQDAIGTVTSPPSAVTTEAADQLFVDEDLNWLATTKQRADALLVQRFDALLSMGAGSRTMDGSSNTTTRDLFFASLSSPNEG